MYNYKKKKGKLDKKDYWLYIYRKAKVEKEAKWRGSESNQKTHFGFSMDKGSSCVILFHYQP
jgi:hypothetical protein